jgi:hypothetical protein
MQIIQMITNYFSSSKTEPFLLQNHLENYLSHQETGEKNNTKRLANLVIINLSQKAFTALECEEKEAIDSINKHILSTASCDAHPEWVKPSRLFLRSQQIPEQPFSESYAYKQKTNAEIDAKFHLNAWEFHPSNTNWVEPAIRQSGNMAIEHIRAFIRGESNTLDLSQLQLTSLPKCLFSDVRFENCSFEDNPLKNFPKNLLIGEIQNDKLFDKMHSVITTERGKLTKKLFSEKGIQACINEFTELSQDTAVNKEFAKLKRLQYRIGLERYQKKIKEDPDFAESIPEELKQELKDHLSAFLPDRNFEKEKTCVQKLEKIEALHKKSRYLDDSLIKMAHSMSVEFKQDLTKPQKENAQKIRALLQKHKRKHAKEWVLKGANLKLPAIPSEIAIFTNLKELFLSNNNISVIPPEIKFCVRLTYIDLTNNQIKIIPPEIKYLTKLWELHLDSNQIKIIPPEIKYLKKLVTLTIENNKLSKFASEIAVLPTLEVLYLNNNYIKTIPSGIGLWTELRVLDLQNNQIEVIPAEIGCLSRLEFLRLKDNPIRDIHPNIYSCRQLKTLELNNAECQFSKLKLTYLAQTTEVWHAKKNGPYQFLSHQLSI